MNLLDPNANIFKGIFSREHCYITKRGYYIKDISIFKEMNLKDLVLVDDSVYSFAFQINNGVPIQRWKNKSNDQELKFLLPFLIKLSFEWDVREALKKYFNLERLACLDYELYID